MFAEEDEGSSGDDDEEESSEEGEESDTEDESSGEQPKVRTRFYQSRKSTNVNINALHAWSK